MKKSTFTIKENVNIAESVWSMTLEGDTTDIKAPGQFADIELEGYYLRRPLSVCDWGKGTLTVIYKTVGKGTEKLSGMAAGGKLDILTGLGNGYDMTLGGETPLLIGGGAGAPPMYGLAKRLCVQGKKPTVILGFNNNKEIFLAESFKQLGINTIITTADGSVGTKGFVTDAIPNPGAYSYVYACGPEPMLKSVYNKITTSGQFSFEERMGCGFGACMGCSCKTKYGNKRICKDGPVLIKEEILWD